MKLLELYDLAAENAIEIDHTSLKTMTAFSMPGSIAIDMSKLATLAETTVCFAHELGHEMKGAFYTTKAVFETRARQEERATRWAVEALIPADLLIQAVKEGHTEVFDLAEYFDVTENFIQETIRVHKLQKKIKIN